MPLPSLSTCFLFFLHCCCCWPLPELVHMLPLLPGSSAGACTLSIRVLHFASSCHLAAQIWPCTSHSQQTLHGSAASVARGMSMIHVSRLADWAAAHQKVALITCVKRGCGCRGSRLHEVAAAGCAVVTGSCSAVFLEAYDLNQAAVRAAEEWDLSAESPMSTSPSQEYQRCPNPTPRRAAG